MVGQTGFEPATPSPPDRPGGSRYRANPCGARLFIPPGFRRFPRLSALSLVKICCRRPGLAVLKFSVRRDQIGGNLAWGHPVPFERMNLLRRVTNQVEPHDGEGHLSDLAARLVRGGMDEPPAAVVSFRSALLIRAPAQFGMDARVHVVEPSRAPFGIVRRQVHHVFIHAQNAPDTCASTTGRRYTSCHVLQCIRTSSDMSPSSICRRRVRRGASKCEQGSAGTCCYPLCSNHRLLLRRRLMTLLRRCEEDSLTTVARPSRCKAYGP
jgi:hypothetical protein